MIDTARREERHVGPAEERLGLLLRSSQRRRGGDDLRQDELARDLARREALDGGLVEADHRAERAGDEVELVLHDQLRWTQPRGERQSVLRRPVEWPVELLPFPRRDAAEEHASLAPPGQHRELVDSREQERGELAVDLLVDEQHRQPLGVLPRAEGAVARRLAGRRHTAHDHLLRVGPVGAEHQAVAAEAAPAPRAVRERERRGCALRGAVLVVDDELLHLLERVRRRRAAHPQAD